MRFTADGKYVSAADVVTVGWSIRGNFCKLNSIIIFICPSVKCQSYYKTYRCHCLIVMGKSYFSSLLHSCCWMRSQLAKQWHKYLLMSLYLLLKERNIRTWSLCYCVCRSNGQFHIWTFIPYITTIKQSLFGLLGQFNNLKWNWETDIGFGRR